MATLLDHVDVREKGDKLLLSSRSENSLRLLMLELLEGGAMDVSGPIEIGDRWIASFQHPAKRECLVFQSGRELIFIGPTARSVIEKCRSHSAGLPSIVPMPQQAGTVWRISIPLKYKDSIERIGNIV